MIEFLKSHPDEFKEAAVELGRSVSSCKKRFKMLKHQKYITGESILTSTVGWKIFTEAKEVKRNSLTVSQL